jgi:23S rRNA (adenine2503-C2)-methyltransferase
MTLAHLTERLAALGAKPAHEKALLRAWLAGRDLSFGERRRKFPKTLATGLPAVAAELASLARVTSEHPGADGSKRLLVTLHDGQTIETVLLLNESLCISSQVGCAVGCQFCMTGKSGLIRSLGTLELLAQIALARAKQPVRKLVFMGMGEPSHNLAHVLEAIEILGTLGGIAANRIVFSTVGDHRVFERLPENKVRPVLALSLHTTDAELRSRLLPRAPRIEPAELVELAESYSRKTRHPVLYQWTLLEGVNDTPEEIDRLVVLLKGKRAMLNPPQPRCPHEAQALRRPGRRRRLRPAQGTGRARARAHHSVGT